MAVMRQHLIVITLLQSHAIIGANLSTLRQATTEVTAS